jgi:hypothetical protein
MEKQIEDFMNALHMNINYWEKQKDMSSKEKLLGLTHSFLCMLDGCSGSFDGNIHTLASLGDNFMFHDNLKRER